MDNNSEHSIDTNLARLLRAHNIDPLATQEAIRRLNGRTPHSTAPVTAHLAPRTHRHIIDARGRTRLTLSTEALRDRLERLLSPSQVTSVWHTLPPSDGAHTSVDHNTLRHVGYLLYPQVAFGVLNGGSATSYADRTKNQRYSPSLFHALEQQFEIAAQRSRNTPKALAPALFGDEGQESDSFLCIKMRHLLVEIYRSRLYGAEFGAAPSMPFFQMTSDFTDAPVRRAMEELTQHPSLAPLIERGYTLNWNNYTATQTLLAALDRDTHQQYRVYLNDQHKPRALPGGHGQNFAVLEEIYTRLLHQGYRFALLGNIDNIGYTLDPVGLAVCALQDVPAAFEFCERTRLDVKGGVLADYGGALGNAEIGIDISLADVQEQEKERGRALFNCAIGLLNLERLLPTLKDIIATLPYRLNEQDNDFGHYWQSEQITWEIIKMLDNPLVLVVDKQKRLLPAKLLLDTLLVSGFGANSNDDTAALSTILHGGTRAVVTERYGYNWEPNSSAAFHTLSPQSITEIEQRIGAQSKKTRQQ